MAYAPWQCYQQPARIFLGKTTSRSFAYAGLAIALALCISLGISIRRNNYVNAELRDVSNGGLVFRGKPGAPTVVLMGDSNGSMYGKVLKAICSDLGETLVVISTAGGDALPAAPGEPAELWERSLAVIRKTKPDYLVFASDWMEKLQADPKRLVEAIEAIEPYV